jgi:hypothetical protein
MKMSGPPQPGALAWYICGKYTYRQEIKATDRLAFFLAALVLVLIAFLVILSQATGHYLLPSSGPQSVWFQGDDLS